MKRFFAYFVPSALAAAILIFWAATNPRVLEITADVGSATAAKWLGDHYNGYENKEVYDPEKALHWFKRAADLGSVDALFQIGDLHLRGLVDGHTYKTAFDYYHRAAEADHLGAIHGLAFLLEIGLGTDQDLRAAERWLKRAIELGNDPTELSLALLYFQNSGEFTSDKVSRSLQEIQHHAEKGATVAKIALADAYIDGESVPKDVEKGLGIYFELAELEPYFVHMVIGDFYLRGEAADPDYQKALDHFQKSVEAGNMSTYYSIAEMYEFGLGVEQDFSTAAKHYRTSIEAKFFGGLTNLGILYRDGTGVERDYDEAIRLFERAEELEIRGGSANFGWMQLHGMGMPEEVSKGLALIKTAADEKDVYGAFYLAKLLETGEVIPQDRDRALELYRLADENGYYPAKLAVKRLEKAQKTCVSPAKEKAGRRCPAFPYQ